MSENPRYKITIDQLGTKNWRWTLRSTDKRYRLSTDPLRDWNGYDLPVNDALVSEDYRTFEKARTAAIDTLLKHVKRDLQEQLQHTFQLSAPRASAGL